MMNSKSIKWTPYIWILLALLALLLRRVLVSRPEIVEQYYSRGFFVFVRKILDTISYISPIPLMYVFIGIILFYILKKIVELFSKKETWSFKIIHFLLSISNLLAALVFFFLVLWGYNYQRVPLENQLAIFPKPLQLDELQEELELLTPILIEKRKSIPNSISTALNHSFFPENFEQFTNTATQDFLRKNNYPNYSSANARFLQPDGVLLVNSTAGIYFPWVGESNIDNGLHPLMKPYVLSHEFAHAYGFGDEGSCNFIAYLACDASQNPFVSYCGNLGYWRTLASNYKSYKPKEYAAFRANLPAGIIADLNAINETHRQYPDIFPKFRDASYDAFLKAQGIEEGNENYNRVIMLGRAWRLKNQKK